MGLVKSKPFPEAIEMTEFTLISPIRRAEKKELWCWGVGLDGIPVWIVIPPK